MASIVIYSCPRKGKDRFFVKYKKEVLSGPWKTNEEAVQAKSEWVVPKMGGFVKRGEK